MTTSDSVCAISLWTACATGSRGSLSLKPPPGRTVSAVRHATGVRPTAVGALPPQCAALNRAYVSVNELTVRAALEGDPRLVRHALMVDPNTAASLTLDQIWAMADDLTRAHGDLLPEALRA